MKTLSVLTLALVLLLAACAPAAVAVPTSAAVSTVAPSPSVAASTVIPLAATGELATPVVATGIVGTASAGTASSVTITSLPANATPLPVATMAPDTPIPTLASGSSPTELKYQLLARYPTVFFCDPDFYPVARGDEAGAARQRFTELQANAEEFQAILKHNGLSGAQAFGDDQKLLVYREHKKLSAIQLELAGNSYQFQLETADGRNGLVIKGRIDGQGAISVDQQTATIATCPICLAGNTLIDTPNGPVAVKDLRAGDAVWTVSAAGVRVQAAILKTVAVAAPSGHQMAHVVLSDGRELWASPGHPTADGRALGSLKPGDTLDGALVSRAERVRYDQPATYDLLPAGDTGFYWANGMLIGSTLSGR